MVPLLLRVAACSCTWPAPMLPWLSICALVAMVRSFLAPMLPRLSSRALVAIVRLSWALMVPLLLSAAACSCTWPAPMLPLFSMRPSAVRMSPSMAAMLPWLRMPRPSPVPMSQILPATSRASALMSTANGAGSVVAAGVPGLAALVRRTDLAHKSALMRVARLISSARST